MLVPSSTAVLLSSGALSYCICLQLARLQMQSFLALFLVCGKLPWFGASVWLLPFTQPPRRSLEPCCFAFLGYSSPQRLSLEILSLLSDSSVQRGFVASVLILITFNGAVRDQENKFNFAKGNFAFSFTHRPGFSLLSLPPLLVNIFPTLTSAIFWKKDPTAPANS